MDTLLHRIGAVMLLGMVLWSGYALLLGVVSGRLERVALAGIGLALGLALCRQRVRRRSSSRRHTPRHQAPRHHGPQDVALKTLESGTPVTESHPRARHSEV